MIAVINDCRLWLIKVTSITCHALQRFVVDIPDIEFAARRKNFAH